MINTIFNAITGLFLSKLTILIIDAIAVYLAVVVYRDNKQGRLNRQGQQIYATTHFRL